MALPTFVQGCQGKNLNGTSATAIFGSPVTAHSLIAVAALWFDLHNGGPGSSNPSLSVSDSVNGGHTIATASQTYQPSGGVTVAVFYILDSGAGTPTVTLSTPYTGALFLAAHEVKPGTGQTWKYNQYQNFGSGRASATNEMQINYVHSAYPGDFYSFACFGVDSMNFQPITANDVWNARQYVQNSTPIDTGQTTTGGAELLFYGALNTFDKLDAGNIDFVWSGGVNNLNTAVGILANFNSVDPICDVPVASLGSGTYTGTQSITLTQAQSKDMYYTLDGSTPTTSSTHYVGTAITVSSSLTLNVLAHDASSVLANSSVRFVYTILPPPPPNSNITISWERRTRIGGAWLGGTGTVPISEQSELYNLYIMNAAGTSILRSVHGLTTNSFLYTSAMQYTDFGIYPTSIYVKVAQVSAAVGEGYMAINTTLALGGQVPGGGANATQILGDNISGTASDGDILRYNSGTSTWDIIGPVLKRQNILKTTASLADTASESGSININCGTFAMIEIHVDRDCRVEFYSTAAFRTADAGRAYNTPPSSGGENGIIADFGFDSGGAQTWVCSPALIGANTDSSPLSTLYYRVTNMSGSTSTVAVTITIVPLEIL